MSSPLAGWPGRVREASNFGPRSPKAVALVSLYGGHFFRVVASAGSPDAL